MARYIDAELFFDRMERHEFRGETIGQGIYTVLCETPTADVQPVVHAHWESAKIDAGLKTCSKCHMKHNGTKYYYINPMWNYCPHCGAKMDEVEE